MKKIKKFYVTTPIYYPTAKPHIGSAYTTIAADILARWHKLKGDEVFFLTGTDEHTKKVVNAALKEGKTTQEFIDALIPEFKRVWSKLNIKYDRFIRTSDKDHERYVEHILDVVHKKGDIYKGTYEGLYCPDCEAYYTERDAEKCKCPVHKKALEQMKEETYFFRLSKYQKPLLELYRKHPEFISPEFRRKEIVNRVKEGLKDLSISRTNQEWGVKLPFDKTHVAYVWFDALTNYLSGIGALENPNLFKKFWPADIHLVGKDILWFHSVIWPAMLFSAGIAPPKEVFAHGWLTVNAMKIGKSAGNAVDLDYLISLTSVDSIRYFLFREVPFGQDGEFNDADLIKRHNTELADKLGNLVARIQGLIIKADFSLNKGNIDKKLFKNLSLKKIEKAIEDCEFDKALSEIFSFVDFCNGYVQYKRPWQIAEEEFTDVVYTVSDAIRIIAILLWPFMPNTSEKIAKAFSFKIKNGCFNECEPGLLKPCKIKEQIILFKKIKPEEQEEVK